MIVSWNTTNRCNMYCRHCYRDAGAAKDQELNTDEAKNLIEEIAACGFRIMIFSGGEPLLRDDLLDLVAYARDRGLRPVLGTNGTLINRSKAQELKVAGACAAGISLDSIDPVRHDRFRRYPGGWWQAVEAMDNCRQVGLPFQVHTTVMDWNWKEIELITDVAVSIGAGAHHVFFLVPTGRGQEIENETLRTAEYEMLLERLMEKQVQTPIEIKPTCAPQFMRIARMKGIKTRFSRGCLAGISYCIVSPSGDVQACAYLDRTLGNIRREGFKNIWEQDPVLTELRTEAYKGGCGTCGYRKICGGCRARAAYYHNGDFMAEEPWCAYREQRGGNSDAS